MCGIFGVSVSAASKTNSVALSKLTQNLFLLSESRGKDSAGIAYLYGKNISVKKRDIPAHIFIKSTEFESAIAHFLSNQESKEKSFIGHCRMVTNGSEENPLNNQPVEKFGNAIVHNGIICNVNEIWLSNKNFQRTADVDTEVLLDLLGKTTSTDELQAATIRMFKTIEGSASIAHLSPSSNSLLIATNTGSLFFAVSKALDIFLFASELHILKTALENSDFEIDDFKISPLNSRNAAIVDLSTLSILKFEIEYNTPHTHGLTQIKDNAGSWKNYSSIEKTLVYRLDKIKLLKRCTKCILPETFPFISFNTQGVCNYCENYAPSVTKNRIPELENLIAQHKKTSRSSVDCIVPFSGGRDSSYGLHYLVKEMGIRPITYTYDWGMVTDLARRNVSRMCASLGVENILISADIKRKRSNIKKNVSAWLKKPDLGMVPLFMAGDKQFLYYVNIIKKQTGVDLDIWMPNKLENTDFKTGFCNIAPAGKKGRIDSLPLMSKINMLEYYGYSFLKNPSYLNSSLIDSIFAFFSYYFEPRNNYTVLFDYLPWDETIVNQTLLDGYNWEISPDTTSTWRIGDGTAPFYNYIYNTIAGFSEVDTFRSNQIREGMIDRNLALSLAEVENAPRFESIKWYLDTIGLDFKDTIQIINGQKTLY